jgi:hypothetical protein
MKEVFNIHLDVLQDFVEPLHSLLTNTFLEEAQEKKAYLPEEDKEVTSWPPASASHPLRPSKSRVFEP